jgi:YD repeat-containing protein
VTDPANNVTQYNYDTENNLTSITDANNHTTYFAYNARGWVTQTTFPSNLYESYGYDAGGNLTSKTDRKNQTIQYVYDALNRLSTKTYPDSTTANYVYDLVGKIRQVTDPTGVYGFAYDNMGRLIGMTTQYTFVAGTYSNAYTYDAGGVAQALISLVPITKVAAPSFAFFEGREMIGALKQLEAGRKAEDVARE